MNKSFESARWIGFFWRSETVSAMRLKEVFRLLQLAFSMARVTDSVLRLGLSGLALFVR